MSSKLNLKINKNSIALIGLITFLATVMIGLQAQNHLDLNASLAEGSANSNEFENTLIANLPDLALASDTDSQSTGNDEQNVENVELNNVQDSTSSQDSVEDSNTKENIEVGIELDGEGNVDVADDSGKVKADFSNNDTLDGDKNENELSYDRETNTDLDNNVKVKNDDHDIKLITGNNTIKDNKNPITVKPSSVKWNINSN